MYCVFVVVACQVFLRYLTVEERKLYQDWQNSQTGHAQGGQDTVVTAKYAALRWKLPAAEENFLKRAYRDKS